MTGNEERYWALAIAATVLGASLVPGSTAAQSVAITPVTVIDVREGVPHPDRTVVVTGNRITAVGPVRSVEIPADARVVDGTGKYLIPGLWDMHVHSSSDRITRETFLPLYVANGVTGVRDMRADCFAPCDEIESPFEQVQEWRRDIAAGELEGPRIVASSPFIQSPPTGEASSVEAPETAAEVRVLVDRLAERGVDFLKVYSMLSREGFFALAEAARARDLPFAGHVPLAVRASEASQAGLRSIEHLTDILIQCSSREQELRGALLAELQASWLTPKSVDLLVDAADSHSDEKCQTLATRLAENGTWVTPTLRVARWLVVDSDDPRLEYQAPEERAYWAEELAKQPSTRPRAPRYWRREQELVPVLEEAGVPILAGSDVGTPGAFPGFGLQDELELLVEVGLTPANALRAATLEPARYLDATDSLGTVEAGKLADLVLLDANPLEDISHTQKIAAVVLDGRYLDRAALDQLLADAERAANPPDAAGDSVSSQDRSPAKELQSDTVHVAPPTGEKETDRASILAALVEVEPGGTVLFSPGTYLIGEFLRVEVPRITLQGHPDGTTLRGCDPDDYPPYREQLGRCNGLELATGHIAIRGLTIEHAWHGIYIGCCLKDLARSYLGEGEGPPLAQPGGHLIEDNRLRSLGTAMRVIGESSEPIVIRDNVFRNTFHALAINGGTAYVLDNDIAAPEPERVPSGRHPVGAIIVFPAPPARDCGPNVIAGNRIDGHPDGIGLGVGVPGTRCERNVVRDNTIIARRVPIGESGQAVRVGSESDSTVVGVPIGVGNVAGGEGLPLPPTWRFEGEAVIGEHLIEGNQVQGADGIGIEIRRSSDNRIVDNVVTGIDRRELFPGNVANSADPEAWRDANGSGIWLSPGSDGNEIVGNTFEDVAAAAVFLEGDYNRVELRNTSDSVRDLGRGNRIVGVQDAEVTRTRTFSGLVAPAFPYAQPESVGVSSETLDRLGDEIAGWTVGGWHYDQDLVGAELLVIKHGKAIFHEAYGWSDREASVPVERNSIWSIKSMSKPVTTTAALMLADEGALSLDDPVSRYIPTFPDDSTTIRHLLSHTSGYGGEEGDYDWTSLRTLVEDWAADGPSESWEEFHYSDFNFQALGYIVGEVSGTPIDRFTEERIISALGLGDTSTGFADDPTWRARLNPWYRWKEDAKQYDLRWATNREPWVFYNAAWGMFSTTMDYAKFMALWMNGGEWNGTRLLSQATVEEGLRPQGMTDETSFWTGAYGYGWFVDDLPPEDGRSFAHGGGDGTLAMAFPADSLIVIYMTHSRGGHHMSALVNRIYMSDLVTHPGLDPEYFPLAWADEADVDTVGLTAEQRSRFVGTYRTEEGPETVARVWEEEGRLHLRYGPRGVKPDLRYDLVPLGEGRFALGHYENGGRVSVTDSPPYRVQFVMENGAVQALELRRGDEVMFHALQAAGE